MINFNGSMLDLKRILLAEEAKKLFELQEKGEGGFLLRTITGDPEFYGQNWGICFLQQCIKNADDIGRALFPEWKDADLVFDDDMLKFWQNMDRRYRKLKPAPGDLVIMHYVKQNKLLNSGQIGIIVGTERNLSVRTLEGGVISQFDDEPIASQKDGIRERLRSSKGTAKMRVLGYLSPWMER